MTLESASLLLPRLSVVHGRCWRLSAMLVDLPSSIAFSFASRAAILADVLQQVIHSTSHTGFNYCETSLGGSNTLNILEPSVIYREM